MSCLYFDIAWFGDILSRHWSLVLAQTFYPTFVEINLESVTKAYHDLFYGALHEDNTLDALLGFNSFDWQCNPQLIEFTHETLLISHI